MIHFNFDITKIIVAGVFNNSKYPLIIIVGDSPFNCYIINIYFIMPVRRPGIIITKIDKEIILACKIFKWNRFF